MYLFPDQEETMIKIGINTDNWRHADKPVDYCFKVIAGLGIEYTELEAVGGTEFFTGLGFSPFIPLDSDPLELRKKLDKYGLKVSQLDVSFPINRWECIDFIRRGIMFASRLGVPCVDTTDGATKLPGLTDTEQLGIIKYHLAQCLPVAENHQVIINVEPHGPFTTNPETLLEIVEHFRSPYVQINFDTGNSFIAGRDPVKFLEQVLPHVTHVHCKDVSPQLAAAARGKDTGISASVVHIGEGVNADNIVGCIRLLTRHHWDGVFSIESDGEENVKKSVEWLRKQVAVEDCHFAASAT
jgi:sugar phosphate isomerase/epimerase